MKTLLAAIALLTLVSCYSEADYEYAGAYPYEIVNDSLFRNTYFAGSSLGFIVGTDLRFNNMGLDVNLNGVDRSGDYLVSINHPVEYAYKDSPLTREQNMGETKKKPLDVRLDTTKTEKKIFLYKLKPDNHYRMLYP